MSSRTRLEKGFSPKPWMSTAWIMGLQRTFTPATRRRRSGTVRAPDSAICLAVMTVTSDGALEMGISVLVAASIVGCSSPNSVTSPMFFGCDGGWGAGCWASRGRAAARSGISVRRHRRTWGTSRGCLDGLSLPVAGGGGCLLMKIRLRNGLTSRREDAMNGETIITARLAATKPTLTTETQRGEAATKRQTLTTETLRTRRKALFKKPVLSVSSVSLW